MYIHKGNSDFILSRVPQGSPLSLDYVCEVADGVTVNFPKGNAIHGETLYNFNRMGAMF